MAVFTKRMYYITLQRGCVIVVAPHAGLVGVGEGRNLIPIPLLLFSLNLNVGWRSLQCLLLTKIRHPHHHNGMYGALLCLHLCLLVQRVAACLVTLHHPQHLYILRQEARGQQAVDTELQALFQREGHSLEKRVVRWRLYPLKLFAPKAFLLLLWSRPLWLIC